MHTHVQVCAWVCVRTHTRECMYKHKGFLRFEELQNSCEPYLFLSKLFVGP